MEDHYEFIFQKTPLQIKNVLGRLPNWIRNSLRSADTAVQYNFDSGCCLLRQKLLLNPFHVELVQLKSDVSFSFRYKLKNERLFFMLEGSMDFSAEGIDRAIAASESNFYLWFNSPGLYDVHCKEGSELALLISVKLDQLLEAALVYPNLTETLLEMIDSDKPIRILPYFPINNYVKSWLGNLHGFADKNRTIMGGMLHVYVGYALEYYEELLVRSGVALVYRVRRFIDKHFTDSSLNVARFTAIACMSKTTLQKKFKVGDKNT